MSKVVVMKTSPQTVLTDVEKLMHEADYERVLPKDARTILKLNLSWSLFFPACSTSPWQLEGVVRTLKNDGYNDVTAMENKTVVTNPWKGAANNKWLPVLQKYGIPFMPLTDVEWVEYKPKHELLVLDKKVFPEGVKIPKDFIGSNVLHLPTMKCVHPDTEIILEDGSWAKIKDVVESVHSSGYEVTEDGDMVATSNHYIVSIDNSGEIIRTKAEKFWKTPVKGNFIEIKTKTGKNVITSKIHPFLAPEGWKHASKLNKYDRIAIPRIIKIHGVSQQLPRINKLNHSQIDVNKLKFQKSEKLSIKKQKEIIKEYIKGATATTLAKKYQTHCESIRSLLKKYKIDIRWTRKWATVPERTSEDFWRWFGYFISEGYAFDCNGSFRISIPIEDKAVGKDIVSLTKRLFGIPVKIRRWGKKTPEYYFDCNNLKPFFEKLGLNIPTNSATKIAPPLLYKCPDSEIASFLQGLFEGDGTVTKNEISITSKSEKLCDGIVKLLLRLGVIGFKSFTYSRATNSKMKKEKYYLVRIYGEDAKNFSEWVSFLIKTKQKNIKLLIQKRDDSKKPANWDTIPVDRIMFRSIREGLGFTHKSTGKPSSVNSIENGYHMPTREILKYFISLFKKKDRNKKYKEELKHMQFLVSKNIAWDHITEIREIKPNAEYLYDLSVPETCNFVGGGIFLHNTHGHTQMTGSMKNAFGGLLKEVRHHCHKYIHDVLVDLLTIQKEIHKGIFTVMDGAVCGDGAGPRTMIPVIGNYLLASDDSVAIDAIAAKMMGFDPIQIKFIKTAHDLGLGCGDVSQIDIVGENISDVNFHFTTKKSPVIFFDQLFRHSFIEPLLFKTWFFNFCILGSALYHDNLWYPLKGRRFVNDFRKTEWGRLWEKY